MKKPLILNKRLEERNKKDQNNYLINKLRQAKPLVNMKCPESYIFYHKYFRCKLKDDSSNSKIMM